jgi:ribonuclease T2
MVRLRIVGIVLFLVSCIGAVRMSHAQEIKSQPGQFDFYELNMSWSPEFCSNMNTLTPQEKADAGKEMECSAPHGFVLHGLWPQNNDGSYPGSCGYRPGPRNPERNLDMTPNLALLKHEWAKHGTCTTLSPEGFFATARQAYTSVTVPQELTRLDKETMMPPDQILTMFYRANPSFPPDSFNLSCGNNRLTAIEACFSKDTVHPIACQGLRMCRANTVRITPPNDGGIVQ